MCKVYEPLFLSFMIHHCYSNVIFEKSLFNTQQSNNCKQLCTVLQILSVSGTCVESLKHRNTMLTWCAMVTMPTCTCDHVSHEHHACYYGYFHCYASVHTLEACSSQFICVCTCIQERIMRVAVRKVGAGIAHAFN